MISDRQIFLTHLNSLYEDKEAIHSIRRALNLNNNIDVVEYCKNKVLQNCRVYREDTGLCCKIDGVIIVIEPSSDTAINIK